MTRQDRTLAHYTGEVAAYDTEKAYPDRLGGIWMEPTKPQQYRLTLWTQYRRWLWDGLKAGSFAVAFAAGMLCGLWLALWQMVAL